MQLTLQEIQAIEFLNLKVKTDPHASCDIFYEDIKARLDRIYPLRTVTLTSSEPAFMTPEIKGLLRRKNRLMRAGRIEEASACARRGGKAIEKKTKKHLLGIDSNTGTKELWESVRAIQGKRKEDRNSENLTAEDSNAHYAAMSTDPAYTAPLMKMTSASQKRNQATNEPEVSHLLDHLHHAAEGNDELPAWLLRLVAPVYTEAIALLFNRSIAASHVPKQWNTAII